MPSTAYHEWTTTRARALDEIEQAHAAVGGTGPGRRYATQQINQAYAVLLASQFQGFCRDLHTESVNHLIAAIRPPASLRPLLDAEFTRGRQLDRGNAQPASLGADFGRLDISLWSDVESYDPRTVAAREILERMNIWRNAIAHQSFDPVRLGGTTTLRLPEVRRWRRACRRLARAFDEVVRRHLLSLSGASPW